MDNVAHNIKEYLKANVNLIKLEIADEVGGIISKMIKVIFGLFALLVILLLSLVVIEIGMAILLESHFYGALSTLGIFLLLYLFISKFFKKRLSQIISNQIYEDLIEKISKQNETIINK